MSAEQFQELVSREVFEGSDPEQIIASIVEHAKLFAESEAKEFVEDIFHGI